MEEELNENELEERFYAMIHYGGEAESNTKAANHDFSQLIANARNTVRRYWRTSGDYTTTYQKVNPPKDSTPVTNPKTISTDVTKPKDEKTSTPPKPSPDISVFLSPPQNIKKTIEILDNEDKVVELETSDEDEVIEVALPPKPTICIESSDDEENHTLQNSNEQATQVAKNAKKTGERDVSASPVPSLVSSVSDEFIRGDCIALNISSRDSNNPSFDFSLHDSDLIVQSHSTPAKKKKKKKNKDRTTPSIVLVTPEKSTVDECFATPKSKSKNKKQKTRHEKNIPTDLYDSDSNQSLIEARKKPSYAVTEKSLPSADVYESDSNQSEIVKEPFTNNKENSFVATIEKPQERPKQSSKDGNFYETESVSIVDLTGDIAPQDETVINENIVMGNVTGFPESEDYEDQPIIAKEIPSKFGSTNVPAILYEDLDFDNLKGKDTVCRRRRYSLTTLRAEMEKFYNESWGGEEFNHREIQKSMSRDKSLWMIDPKDRMPSYQIKKKVVCHYCNRVGHRDDACSQKPAVCYMCGSTGHYEPRCPRKICVNCGSPNHLYSTMCRNCSGWGRITCGECGQNGHPSSHCPDVWRRYHNTIDEYSPLEEQWQTKRHYLQYCSGCARRGHLVHSCRISLPFSGLPINSPYVNNYRPIYFPQPYPKQNQRPKFPQNPQDTNMPTMPTFKGNKRQSKSPAAFENPQKKRNSSTSEVAGNSNKNPPNAGQQKKEPDTKNQEEKKEEPDVITNVDAATTKDKEKAPDFIPISSPNRDKKGQMIQDNEVSDTSDVVTSARIYVTSDIISNLKSKEGQEWLVATAAKHQITVQNSEVNSFLNIKGKIESQEAFQSELRDWSQSKKQNIEPENEPENETHFIGNIPKNKNNVLRKLSKSLNLLKQDLGDPNNIYKELNYLQNHHEQLLKQKVVSPKKVSNNRMNINEALKKLNMVLLGQAGLADGPQHLSELYSLQEKLINFRQKTISSSLRKEIGQHYHCIFTAMPRNDYVDLLRKFYVKNQSPIKRLKKRKEHSFRLSPKSIQKKNSNPSPVQENTQNEKKGPCVVKDKNDPQSRQPLVEKTFNKLVFFHKRVLHTRPLDTAMKKTRIELVRRLHMHISSLGKRTHMSSKLLKKMKKIQEQAQMFLTYA